MTNHEIRIERGNKTIETCFYDNGYIHQWVWVDGELNEHYGWKNGRLVDYSVVTPFYYYYESNIPNCGRKVYFNVPCQDV